MIKNKDKSAATRWLPAPAFDCAACGRRLGKHADHVLLGRAEPFGIDRLFCIGCACDRGGELHAKFYADCHERHDLYAHGMQHATRAAAANLFGLWP
jgi:hypothetical protein